MNIGEVIETLRQGGAAARAGWNGTGMRIYLKTFDRCEPCIVLVNAQGMHQRKLTCSLKIGRRG